MRNRVRSRKVLTLVAVLKMLSDAVTIVALDKDVEAVFQYDELQIRLKLLPERVMLGHRTIEDRYCDRVSIDHRIWLVLIYKLHVDESLNGIGYEDLTATCRHASYLEYIRKTHVMWWLCLL